MKSIIAPFETSIISIKCLIVKRRFWLINFHIWPIFSINSLPTDTIDHYCQIWIHEFVLMLDFSFATTLSCYKLPARFRQLAIVSSSHFANLSQATVNNSLCAASFTSLDRREIKIWSKSIDQDWNKSCSQHLMTCYFVAFCRILLPTASRPANAPIHYTK